MRIYGASSLLASLPIAGVAFALVACSSGTKSEAEPATDAGLSDEQIAMNEAQGDSEYQASLQEISDAYQTCVAAGRCIDPATTNGRYGAIDTGDDAGAPSDAGAGTGTDGGVKMSRGERDGITHTDGLISSVTGLLSSVPNKICSVLTPIKDYQQVFYFVGGNASGGAGVVGTIGGDLVWDLYDQQSAGFWYKGGGLASLVGVGASVYTGYGLGKNKANVIDAWSGYFKSAGASLKTPLAQLGVGVSAFVGSADGSLTNIDTSIVGGAISAEVGINLTPLPLGQLVGLNVQQAYWTPSNPLTEAVGHLPWWAITGSSSTSHGTAADGKSYEFTQYPDAKSTAFSLFNGSPAILATPAASMAVALGVLKTHHWTFKDICGPNATQDAGNGSLVR